MLGYLSQCVFRKVGGSLSMREGMFRVINRDISDEVMRDNFKTIEEAKGRFEEIAEMFRD